MFSTPHFKTSHPPSSTLTSVKIKNFIHTLIVSHICRILRSISKVKAYIVDLLRNSTHSNNIHKKHSTKTKKIVMGSFRFHYNWCSSKSSHVIPVPSRVYEGITLTSAVNDSADGQQGGEGEGEGEGYYCHDSQLAGYLQWLEENVHGDDDEKVKQEISDVDMMAEMFIAKCHEKFRLEKQESDRKFQEMLARSM